MIISLSKPSYRLACLLLIIGTQAWASAHVSSLPEAASDQALGDGRETHSQVELAPKQATLRVATWNVFNYLICDRWVEGQFRLAYPKPEAQKTALRAMLHRLQPDILALQEVGGLPFLKELQADLASEGTLYPFTAIVEAIDPDRKIALLSKQPFKAVIQHTRIPFELNGRQQFVKRGLLEVQFEGPTGHWTLYILHLRSRHSVDPACKDNQQEREAEARAIANWIKRAQRHQSNAAFLIAGDFNSTLGEPALKFFLKSGKASFTKLIAAADSRGEVWTQHYLKAGVYSRFDYLLASSPLLSKIPSCKAHIADWLPESLIASDHRLVYVDIEF